MAKEQIQWASPPPLWTHAAGLNDLGARRSIVRQPIILRFAADTFMNDLADLLEQDPARLPDLVANPETWRGPTIAPEPIKPVPLFARTMSRLGLTAARANDPALIPGGKGVSSLIPSNIPSTPKLKLYQPAHQRHYLVTSSLVCGRVGLPDHTINPGRHERASFVLRRMFPPGPLDPGPALPPFDANTWEEYAFIASAKSTAWRRIPRVNSQSGSQLVPGEEQLPMFPMNFNEDDGRRRRLLAGLIPVGKREAYMGATFNKQPDDPAPVDDLPPEPDPRMHFFWSEVTEPWKKLLEQADTSTKFNKGSAVPTTLGAAPLPAVDLPDNSLPRNLKSSREQAQTGSWYIVLDFAKLLKEQIPRVWDLLHGTQPTSGGPINSHEQALADAIGNTKFDTTQSGALLDGMPQALKDQTTVVASLKDALLAITSNPQIEVDLESVKSSYDRNAPDAKWPDFLFPLSDPKLTPPIPDLPLNVIPKDELDERSRKVDELAKLIEAALPDTPPPAANIPINPLISQRPMDMREGWFVIRCVFERPECGPIDPPLLSEPTRAFQMAGFFDPDAPARPIRIALPLDTSPAGLRKFDKNTAFMISDMLCGQIDRVKGMTLGDLVLSVLPWPFHQDLPKTDGGPCTSDGVEVGMICSLSIPIITICALLMLMIIVSLLDIIFRWMPFFIFCFPFPKFKSKS
jgi:hypothetical protein